MGRPSVMTDEVQKIILDRIAGGETVLQICKDEKLPERTAVYRLLGSSEEFSNRYTRAKLAGMEAYADDIVEIADECSNDWQVVRGAMRPDREVVDRSKLRVETRKWIMGKFAPRKYADKQSVEVSGEIDFAAVVAADAPTLAPDEPTPKNPVL